MKKKNQIYNGNKCLYNKNNLFIILKNTKKSKENKIKRTALYFEIKIFFKLLIFKIMQTL